MFKPRYSVAIVCRHLLFTAESRITKRQIPFTFETDLRRVQALTSFVLMGMLPNSRPMVSARASLSYVDLCRKVVRVF
jgi:hypothetical protein